MSMAVETKVVWQDKMAFEAELDGFKLMIDADPKFGGEGRGPKPKGLTLVSLAGCTAMDVRSILGKMRVDFDAFSVSASAELTEDHPKRFVSATLRYYFEGQQLPLPKLRRAVMLSEERYCGVRATLAPTVDISSEIFVNGERVPDEQSAS